MRTRGRSSKRMGKGDRGRSKSKPDFRDLKKNQLILYKMLGYWKVDCPKIKDKNKELKTETNLIQVISTQSGSTLQADGSTQTQ